MIELLISLGFSEVEAKMYLANLSIGIAGVSILAKRAGMNRTSGYSVLAELKQKWYVKEYLRWNTKYFEATDPEDILDMFHKKIKKLDKALPEIKAMSQKYTESPKVRYYQGLEEVKQLYIKRLQDNPSEIKIFKAWIEREKEKEKLKAFMQNDWDADVEAKLDYLELFNNKKIKLAEGSPAQLLQDLLEEKWKLQHGDKDMIVMQHLFEYTLNGKNHKLTSS